MKHLAGLLLLAAATSHDEGGTRHLRYQRPVLLSADRIGQACIELPPEVFSHGERNGEDLRLFQGEREVPYAMRVAMPPRLEAVVRPVSNLGTVHGDTTFEADPPAGSYREVTLDVAAQDFIATVTVTGNHRQPGSAPVLLGAFTIFDLSSQRLGRSVVLHLPPVNFEHLRFQVHGRVTPDSIGGIRFQPDDSSAEDVRFVTALASPAMRQDGHRSVLDRTVPPHVPVDRVRFVPAPNAPATFSRDVTITVTPVRTGPPQDDAEVAGERSSGTLQRIHRVEDGQRVDVERLTVDTNGAPADTAATWHIAVENGDDAPLPLAAIELQMRERDLCFDSAGGSAPLILHYGGRGYHAPQYDYQRLFTPAEHPVRASLGPEAENAGFQPAADSRPFSERHPALLWAGLLLSMAVLGAVALRSARAATPVAK